MSPKYFISRINLHIAYMIIFVCYLLFQLYIKHYYDYHKHHIQRSISVLYLLVAVVYRRLQSNYVIPLPLKYMYTNMGELAIDTIYVHSQIEGTSILLHN